MRKQSPTKSSGLAKAIVSLKKVPSGLAKVVKGALPKRFSVTSKTKSDSKELSPLNVVHTDDRLTPRQTSHTASPQVDKEATVQSDVFNATNRAPSQKEISVSSTKINDPALAPESEESTSRSGSSLLAAA
jgi:hypothetical protein